MSQNEIEQVELSIEEARKVVEHGEMAEKLATVSTFRKIVLDGYFVDEAARLALLFSDPNLSAEQREMVKNDLIGIGAFKRYLSTKVQMGRYAAQSIAEAQEELEHIRQEELEEGDDA
jgi:hypothetical protein